MQTFVINLPDKHEKLNNTMAELAKIPNIATEVSVIAALKTSPGWEGCRLSHLLALSQSPDEPFLIVEDDFVFCTDNPEQLILDAMAQLPNDWDMLYLGATLNQDLDKHSDNLYRLKKGWTTHAIIYNGASGVVEAILKHKAGSRKIDVHYAEVVQDAFDCFITYPMIANQRNGHSDILNKHVDTGNIIQDFYNKHTGK